MAHGNGAYVKVVEGVMTWMRSDRPESAPGRNDGSDACRCCDGNHVFCRYIDIPPFRRAIAGEAESVRLQEWIWDAEYGIPEGSRVRVTVEVVE